MRTLFSAVLLLPCALAAQTVPPLAVAPPVQIQSSLTRALTGEWAGVFEYPYDDQPEVAPKRIQVPAWLTVTPAGDNLTFHFIYDEGLRRISDQTLTITLDVAGSTYSITNSKGRKETYRAEGYESLHDGYGDLLLVGPSIDPHRPVGTHITLGIHRNFLTWSEENRPASGTPFTFRHRYLFTRTQRPTVPAAP